MKAAVPSESCDPEPGVKEGWKAPAPSERAGWLIWGVKAVGP